MEDKNFVTHLEELSALQVDSINGFEQLSGKIEHSELRNFFLENKTLSQKLWEELNNEISKLNGETKRKGTLKGAINHLWMKLKTDILHSDLPKVLYNIELCEEFNLKSYESIAQYPLPERVIKLLQKHIAILKARMQQIKILQLQIKS